MSDVPLDFPERVYVSIRGALTLRYAPDRGVAVVVNRLGNDILELGQTGDTFDTVAHRIAADRPGLLVPIKRLVEPFLSEMIACGYLVPPGSESPEKPAEREEPVPLNQLYLHVTDVCNLRCLYCYNSVQRNHESQRIRQNRIGQRQWETVIDAAADLGAQSIVFTGGEPLCLVDTCTLAAYAKSLGLSTNLLTNGSLIDELLAKSIAKVFDTVVVSLDSWVKEEQEQLRPGASFESVVEGIRRLVKVRVPSLAIRPVLSRLNFASLTGFPRWAMNELGCNQFLPALYLPNSPEELQRLDLLPDPDVYWEIRTRFIEEVNRVGGVTIDECRPLELAGVCGAGGSVLSVAANGDVYPCQCLHFDKYKAGNVFRQSLAQIKNDSAILAAFRRESWPWFVGCADCLLHPHCTATCRVFRFTFEGNESLFRSRMCPFLRNDLENRLWREGFK